MNIVTQLQRDEGKRNQPYQDSVGVWTVGYGHNLAVPLSDQAIGLILLDDIAAAVNGVKRLPVWPKLSDARQGVLVNLAFNLGMGKLLTFVRFLDALNRLEFDEAARELLDSRWATQVGARAQRLVTQLREDRWV